MSQKNPNHKHLDPSSSLENNKSQKEGWGFTVAARILDSTQMTSTSVVIISMKFGDFFEF